MTYALIPAALLAALFIWLFLRRRPHALFVLAYEKTGTPAPSSRLKNQWITAAEFEKTLKRLLARGFTAISPEALAAGKKMPQKPILLAFMGGYQSFIKEIFPLLQKYKVCAAVFLAPDLAGQYNAWQDPHLEPWQNLLTEKELKTLQKSGLVSFGALALGGRDLTAVSAEEAVYLAQESLFRLQDQLGLAPAGFAFWPAKHFDEQKAAEILGGKKNIPVITPVCGINPAERKTGFLKTLTPSKHPFSVRYALWKRR